MYPSKGLIYPDTSTMKCSCNMCHFTAQCIMVGFLSYETPMSNPFNFMFPLGALCIKFIMNMASGLIKDLIAIVLYSMSVPRIL